MVKSCYLFRGKSLWGWGWPSRTRTGGWGRGGASTVLEAKSRCIFWKTLSVSSPSHRREEQGVTGIIPGTWLGKEPGWASSSACRDPRNIIQHTAVCTQGPQALLWSHRIGSRSQAIFQGPEKRTNRGLLWPQEWLTLNYCFSLGIYQCLEEYHETGKFQERPGQCFRTTGLTPETGSQGKPVSIVPPS